MSTHKLSDKRPDLSKAAVDLLDHLQTARAEAYGHQYNSGRSVVGRSWSILITKLEELEALTRYYETNPGLGPKEVDDEE